MNDVKRLLAEATPLPWRHGPLFWEGWSVSDDGGRRVFEVPHIYPICESPDAPGHDAAHQPGVYVDPNIGRSREPDAALIVYAVNRLPDYEAALDAFSELLFVLRHPMDSLTTEDAARRARDAVLRLREQVAA